MTSLEFTEPFRKLRSLEVRLSDRLTVIAGHNGIGKSTILGLIANTFGLTDREQRRDSYFGELFTANIERIVHLALEEVERSHASAMADPVVTANVDGVIVRKRCAMTRRGRVRRARVVPRTIDRNPTDPVGQDAKIPLPTIYLGIRRLAPAGEAEENQVLSASLDMPPEDKELFQRFVGDVIVGARMTGDVIHQSIRGLKKKSAQPVYESHDAQAISLGQDSLGSIATALASFSKLRREMGDQYPGGLLVIDELDAGFHPHAIGRLVSALKTHARQLRLQIIATTHSPCLISAVHPQGGGNINSPDSVVYLVDTTRPRLAEDQSLRAILADMELVANAQAAPNAKTVLGIYFEDEEAQQFFDALVPARKRGALGRRLGVQLKPIALGVSGSHLVALPDKDPLFRYRVLVVDSDTSITRKALRRGNTAKLPCTPGARDTERSPENTIRLFLWQLATSSDGRFHEALRALSITNPTTDLVREVFFGDGTGASSHREKAKAWWRAKWSTLQQWKVVEVWASTYPDEATAFATAFEAAAAATATAVKAAGGRLDMALR